MPCVMEIQGHIATLRAKATLRAIPPPDGVSVDPTTTLDEDRILSALRGEPFAPGNVPGPGDTLTSAIETLKGEFTAEAQRHLGSADIVVSDLRFERGSLEVFLLIAATAKVVKDFNDIAAGLESLSRLVPGRLRGWLSSHGRRVLGREIAIDMADVAAIEMGGALLAGQLPSSTVEGSMSPSPPRADDQAPADQRQNPAVDERSPLLIGASPDRSLTAYLMISHAVLTVALIAAVVVLAIVAL